ncbi:unnamed protein product [Schistosoma margrebowiei]|uniref:PRE_C2HC domain-containing protein n=1 Tax=Schistosoma margrebowiei TaxID=48269 RepID=A0AA84ZB14_9TREM|nr:unnamed protein product [Schistosoma margrebowiei]
MYNHLPLSRLGTSSNSRKTTDLTTLLFYIKEKKPYQDYNMLQPDELDAIEKLNELCEKEEKLDKQPFKKNHKNHHHEHHHNNNNLSSVFRCSDTRTLKAIKNVSKDEFNTTTNTTDTTPTNTTTTNTTTNNNHNNSNINDNHLIPTGLPRIQTKITVKILKYDCCITVILDPTTKLNTIKAMYDLNEQLIIIGYQRLITLKTLDHLPMKFNAIIEQNNNLNYDLTTYVEHRYKVNLNMYYLNSARVKQKNNIVYIIIPRKI